MSMERVSFPTAASTTSTDMGEAATPHHDETAQRANGGARGELLGRVVDTAHQTIDRLADRVAPHVGKLEEGMHGAGDLLHERADQMRDIGGEWIDSMRTSVREHPIAAVGIALAVGMLVARMSER